ncbi:pyridoxamine 5'-phosphate oxidase [Amycolatopsis antarctica]|uniref:Pyridoxamine 5'-phosphate oxidase n=1 Tax=Amycolatopsis antarctica TaxID=1854586 RepID=A0A263D787_9PSEU|nr:pyridoxamine 5'-phosphate oxidase family protein [Amycolatopsis antarctica]OZM74241.1 pyridoxamine 5'-phosphate oxidase [Amycolatopsis antarctica]
MSTVHERIDGRLRDFVSAQPVFFVATAPDGPDGHVNVSPKGYPDTFTVLDEHTVAYLDLEGSGVETIAHLRQNERITLMFCAFSGPPNIVRLYGHGRVVTPQDPGFGDLLARFGPHPGVRTVIVVDVERIADSCGYSVPEMTLERDRDVLDRLAGTEGSRKRRTARMNAERRSIDDIPALRPGETDPVSLHSATGPPTACR